MTRFFSILSALVFFATVAAAQNGPAVFINEIHYDNVSADQNEGVEVAGPAGTDLTGWRLVPYNGANGLMYTPQPVLSGPIPEQTNGFGARFFGLTGLQNGAPDGIALLNPAGAVVQFLSYEGSFRANDGPALGMTSIDIGVTESESTTADHSLQLQGAGTNYGDFTWAAGIVQTRNAVNTGQSFGGVVPARLSINDVQVVEGNSGTVNATFTVTRSGSLGPAVTFDLATADNTATTTDADYIANSLTAQTIGSNLTSYTFTVVVNGDTAIEDDETFFVNLSNVTGAVVDDSRGIGTIRTDDDPPVATNIIINELDSDTPGTDAAEFIELFDGGVGNTSLTGLVVVLYNGSNDQSYAAFDLDGRATDSNGYFTLGNAAVTGVDLVFGGNFLQNGADAVALYAGNATSFPNGTAVVTTNLIDAVVYGTDDPDDAGLLALLNPGEPQADEDGAGSAATHSIQRCANGSGGARDTSAFLARTPSPDRANDCPAPPPPAVARTISEIQGDGGASTYDGTNVITSGVVTLLRANGFFMQVPDLDVDRDPNTSEGIFVYTAVVPTVMVGDMVTVTGEVDEFFTLTQVRARPDGVVIGPRGVSLPSPVAFSMTLPNPLGAFDQLEKFEGMRVHVVSAVAVSPSEFGEASVVVQGIARPFREPGLSPTDLLPAGAPCCIPRFDGNPELFVIDTDGRLGGVAINANAGASFSNVTGPLDFSFGSYRVITETDPTVSGNISATPAPLPNANEFTVASFNLENFGTIGHFPTKLAKASLAIRGPANSPDIIGVEEVADIDVLTALATKVNADAVAAGQPNPMYEARLIEGDDRFSNDIDVGFLVKTSRVSITSVVQEGKGLTFIDPSDGSTEVLFERPPLVLRANVRRANASSFPVTVIVNHPQSLIDVADPIRGPRQRFKRQVQAEFTANLAQSLQSENLVLVGDFNSYQFSDGYVDVIGTILGSPAPADQVLLASDDLVNPNLTDLVDTLSQDQRYSFVFQGNAQVLDHILVDSGMLARLSRFAYVRLNADFSEALFSADATRPERISDHDIPVAYFNLPALAADLEVTGSAATSALSGSSYTYSVVVRNNGPDGAPNATLTVPVPASTALVSAIAPTGWTCTNNSCTTPMFSANASATFTLTFSVNCATADATTIANVASVRSDVSDPVPSNNASTVNVVVSNPAPAISNVTVNKPVIGPPNHRMIDVQVGYTIADNCGTVTSVLSVASNQPINGTGDGDTAPDWEIVNANHVRLRAERAANEDRVYTITITATDSSGAASTATTTVTVPANQS